jgi:hypothetical protein
VTSDDIRSVITTLDKSDPELTRLLQSFTEDWKASGADRSPATAEKLRSALNTALQSKMKERAEAARRAVVVNAALEKLAGEPSLRALKQAAEK